MSFPCLEIDCRKIAVNIKLIIRELKGHSIDILPVTKVFMGHPEIAATLVESGAVMLADSRIENIERMRCAGIKVPMMLIRTPMLSQVERVVSSCEVSLNTELVVIKALSEAARTIGYYHGVIIMVELGDLREGVMVNQLESIIKKVLELPNIIINGIGANLTCRYGVAPDRKNMDILSNLVNDIERRFDIKMKIISGGNSANILWALKLERPSRINQLRLGESIYFGVEALKKQHITGTYKDAIILIAEVIESSVKPSKPWGCRYKNAFGDMPEIVERGMVNQALLAIGRQDVNPSGLRPPIGIKIVASTSDHLVVESEGHILKVGQTIKFRIDYVGLLSAMTSPYIKKNFYH
ncbi:alanine/ornithine racemase family PLP-dependent enzyme [Aestuariibacter sp. A3R04]|uniref:alanine/ornithine racemase family PLP-dependent enzyme n=1 Tax=Aestuariibacter sp. A3R04 TaxID=2841571 RepID=UPI001C0A3965|nr:alanine/ornithine racemase family PLP-dependent enzyme [Aestuariibacter sp. A3R04]MBU3022297.1 alanine/ornithine racemase family PLP-dependent enzyme [Aestuariibacter sp. A3R04]